MKDYFMSFAMIILFLGIIGLSAQAFNNRLEYKLIEDPSEDLNKVVFDLCIEKGGVPILDDWDEAVDCRFNCNTQ